MKKKVFNIKKLGHHRSKYSKKAISKAIGVAAATGLVSGACSAAGSIIVTKIADRLSRPVLIDDCATPVAE